MSADLDDDGDEPMDTTGIEPEAPLGDDGDPDDPSDPDGDGAAAAGVAAIIHRARGRKPISDEQRAKWRELAKGKQAAPEDDPEEQLLDPPPDSPASAGQPQGSPNIATPPPAAAPPPAPSLDPEVTRLREDFTKRIGELDAREKALADREASGDWGKLANDYAEKGAPAIIDVIKKLAGVTTDDELKAEVADLITQLSASVLSVDVPQSVRDKIESKLARRSLTLTKEQLRKADAERQQAAEREKEAQNIFHAKHALQQAVEQAAKDYPHLAEYDEAGTIVFEIIDGEWKKNGTRLAWTEAAKRANDHLQKMSDARAERRRRLLGATSANAGTGKSGKQQAQQGKPPGSQAQAPKPTETPAPEPPPLINGKWNAEAHRKNTMRKYRQAFKESGNSD